MAIEQVFSHKTDKKYNRIPRTDLVGKVVRLKSHQKFGVITSVSYCREGRYYNNQEDKATVKWIVGYSKPKTTEVSLYSLYDCQQFIDDMNAETAEYQANIDGVNKYYDQP